MYSVYMAGKVYKWKAALLSNKFPEELSGGKKVIKLKSSFSVKIRTRRTLKLSDQELGPIHDKLRLLLENLSSQFPVNAPDSRYASLIGFQPDAELVEVMGSRSWVHSMYILSEYLDMPQGLLVMESCQYWREVLQSVLFMMYCVTTALNFQMITC